VNAATKTKRKHGPRSLLWCAKRDAKKRGLKWLLGDQRALVLMTQPCHWCGTPPSPYSGLDRLNNEKFYRANNSRKIFSYRSIRRTRSIKAILDVVQGFC
jgi:hypothetical protein